MSVHPAAASGTTDLPANSNRRRGWVIASEDGVSAPVARPTKFDARSSAAAWNKGKGPSPASIPSRASSLAPTPTSSPQPPATPSLPPLSFQLEPELALQPISPPALQQLPPHSLPRRQLNSSMGSSDGESEAEAVASNGKRRPSPPLLVPPKQTYRKSPSVKVLPPSAYTDHKRMMAGVGLANRSPKPASPSAARTTFASATALIPSSPPKGYTPARRAQQASSSSTASTSSTGFEVVPTHAAYASGSSTSSEASSVSPEPVSPSAKGKERALDGPDLPTPVDNVSSAAYRREHVSIVSAITPLPPVSERSSISDRESKASPSSESCTSSDSGPALRKKPSDLRIELPPPSTESSKPATPAITVDSSHVNDGPSLANGGIRPRKRRSTGSAQGNANGDEDTVDDDDNSSWPSTPSTTPLDYYFSDAAVLKAATKNAHHQTTTQIVCPNPDVLSMGMPMVVVTSPSTASEVSSERRSSASSSAPSDSSVPSVPTVTPAPALPKVTEESIATEEEATPKAAKKSLTFDVPTSPAAAEPKGPLKTYNFFSKMGPSKSSNRNSVEAAAPTPLANRTSVDAKRQSGERRRSVELKPILLHSAAKKSSESSSAPSDNAIPRAPARTEQQQQRRMSGGRAPVRSNVVPYHSRKGSEGSVTSSSTSAAGKRMSLDRSAGDPRFSPMSHVSTAITVPSPVIATKRPPATKPVVVASSSQNRFAASMPSLHHTQEDELPQVASQEPPSPSAIRQLIDSQKGRTTKDNDSIAEWISVSHTDVPASQDTHPYGNGGAGEFSNQKREPKKPWKSNRFAVSEAALPPASAANNRLPHVAAAPQPKHVRVRSASTQSLVSPPASSLKPSLGFTTAARNAVLQNLYAGRSVSALAAGSVIAASMGRVSVPSPTGLAQLKSKAKKQAKAEKKQKKKSEKKSTSATQQASASKQIDVSPKPEEAEVRLNLSGNRHSLYDIQIGMGTVNSMMPELGNWTDPTDISDSPVPAAQPFRDYEDDDSDLFDSGSDSDDDGDWAGEGEEAEVPVRLGQLSKEPEMLNVFFSSLRSNKVPAKTASPLDQNAELAVDTPVVRSPSLANVAPGSVEHKGKEIRLCVDEAQPVANTASGSDTTVIWKAVKVCDLDKSSCNDGGYLELKRQKQARQNRTKAMKLESEVSRGAFASFVGNNSPVRQAKRTSVDFNRSPGSPIKASRATDVVDDELFICKEAKVSYVVRQAALPGVGTDQLLEIVRRSSTGSWLAPNHLSEDLPLRYQLNDQDTRQRHHLPGTPVFNLDKAFPSPFLGSESSGQFERPARRQESSASTGSALDEDEARRVLLRVHREDVTGFEASFNSHDGSVWVWKARALASGTDPVGETDTSLANGLNGFDLHLYTIVDANTVELASYTTESQLRNALGLFQARGKRTPKPLPDDAGEQPVVLTQVTPLATPAFGGSQIRVDAAPRRGIRGGPLLRHQASAGAGVGAPGSAAWKQRQWQNQRAAISTESVVQVHNNAVANARSSHLVDIPVRKLGADAPGTSVSQGNRKGELHFQPECQDRDLAVVSLLALLGMVKA